MCYTRARFWALEGVPLPATRPAYQVPSKSDTTMPSTGGGNKVSPIQQEGTWGSNEGGLSEGTQQSVRARIPPTRLPLSPTQRPQQKACRRGPKLLTWCQYWRRSSLGLSIWGSPGACGATHSTSWPQLHFSPAVNTDLHCSLHSGEPGGEGKPRAQRRLPWVGLSRRGPEGRRGLAGPARNSLALGPQWASIRRCRGWGLDKERLRETARDREAWCIAVHGVTEIGVP